jgi:hypothetical protein
LASTAATAAAKKRESTRSRARTIEGERRE